MRPELGARILAVFGFVGGDVGHARRLGERRRRLRFRRHDWARRHNHALGGGTRDADEVFAGGAVCLIDQPAEAAFLQRDLWQRGARAGARHENSVGLARNELQHLPRHRRVGAAVALITG